MNDLPYYLVFSHSLGIGPVRFDILINHLGGVRGAYNAKQSALSRLIGAKIAADFVKFRNKFDPWKKQRELHKKGIIVLSRKSRGYPQQFLELDDGPICIYIKGDLNRLNFLQNNFLAIVGTRAPTSYGTTVARKFSRELGAVGFNIVSGMAYGIDSEAHKGALDVGAGTVAFLGCGVDIPYPSGNQNLYDQIISRGGLIVSEFPPGMTVKPGLFIARNRLISGLSKGTLVIEGGEDSGALITAGYAAKQGKELFAVPGQITSLVSGAPHLLLKQGAKLVSSLEDILEEFGMKSSFKNEKQILIDLSDDEISVYEILKRENKTIDEIAQQLNISVSRGMEIITGMELKNIIVKNQEGRYQLC